jgi:hypothetical protein
MVDPQRRFFRELGVEFPGWVVEVETTSIETSVAAIHQALRAEPAIDTRCALDFIEHWLASNSATSAMGR